MTTPKYDPQDIYVVDPLLQGANGTSADDFLTISMSAMNDSDLLTVTDYSNVWLTNGTYSTNPLHVQGNATIDGELTVQGVKLSQRLDKIEERLAILHPNKELEEKWENLRGLRKMYMELEAEIKEKEKIWGILKR